MEIAREVAERTAAAALRAHGVGEADAALTAEVLVAADARGKESHGLLRLPRIVRGLEAGTADPKGTTTVARERGAVAVLDGGAQLGPVVAVDAVAEAIARAEEHGAGVVGVRDATHLGMLGYYTDYARTEGYVAVAMTNTEPAMPPHGGSEAVLGTNPIAVGLPTDPPFNLDMSTAAISRGEVLRRKEAGERLPEGVALDAAGRRTTDPAAALDGVVLPVAGPKGSGLAVAVEVLAGGLVGAAMGTEVTGTYHTTDPCTKGDLFLVLDPDAFAPDFEAAADAFLDRLKASGRAPGVEEILLPGERSLRADRTSDRVEVPAELWETISEHADAA